MYFLEPLLCTFFLTNTAAVYYSEFSVFLFQNADMIIVMNEGMITGIGKHDELLENNSEYSEIYYSQMDKKEA